VAALVSPYWYFAMQNTPKRTKRRTIYFLHFKIESKNFKILNPSADDKKVPSYTVQFVKTSFYFIRLSL
jgi:hypothetical protein